MSILSINETRLLGFLGAKPEIKATSNGEMAIMTIYTNRPDYKDKKSGEVKQGKKQKHRVVSFVPQVVNFAKVLGENERIMITGYNDSRDYEENGTTKYMHEVVAETLSSVDSKEVTELRAQKSAARKAA